MPLQTLGGLAVHASWQYTVEIDKVPTLPSELPAL